MLVPTWTASRNGTSCSSTVPQLAQLMIEHDIGVSEVGRYVVKQIDSDYFGDAQ